METLLILYVGTGLLLAALSMPLILGKIRPNPLYGVRVKKTLEDPAIWYPVNAYAAKRLLVAGLGISASAVLLFLMPDMDLLIYALSCAGIGLAGLVVAIVQTFHYLRSFPGGAGP